MAKSNIIWYVVDDGGVYNVFSSEDFDEKGRYKVNPVYLIQDFDIVHRYTREDSAWDEAERLNFLRDFDGY